MPIQKIEIEVDVPEGSKIRPIGQARWAVASLKLVQDAAYGYKMEGVIYNEKQK